MRFAFLLFLGLSGCYDKTGHLDTSSDTEEESTSPCAYSPINLTRAACDDLPAECQCACYSELGAQDGALAGDACERAYPEQLRVYLEIGISDDALRDCFYQAATTAWSEHYQIPGNDCPEASRGR